MAQKVREEMEEEYSSEEEHSLSSEEEQVAVQMRSNADAAHGDAERSSSSSLGVGKGASGARAASANVSRDEGTSSAPAGKFTEQSDDSDLSPGSPNRRGRGGDSPPSDDDEMEAPTQDPSHSWHATLCSFPGLIQRYPLACSSEFENGETEVEELNGTTRRKSPPDAGDKPSSTDLVAQANAGAAAAAAALAEADGGAKAEKMEAWRSPPRSPAGAASASSRSSPSGAAGPQAKALQEMERVAGERAGSTPARFAPPSRAAQSAAQEERCQARGLGAWPGSGIAHRNGHSAPCTPAQGRVQATPHSMGSRNGGYPQRCYPNDDLAAAWDEVEQVRQSLLRREKELSQREAAVQRAEARNTSAARQLGDLRLRLDDYSAELEQSVVALTAQKQSVREERRQTLEMQARVRRMALSSVRDDVVASKARDWQRVWTPTESMGP